MTCYNVSSMVTGDDLKLMGKDSWFRVCTSSKGNKHLERLINLFASLIHRLLYILNALAT